MKPEEWVIYGDVGVSARTIWAVMRGLVIDERKSNRYFDTPHDPGDFGRCYKLLELFPDWKAHLDKVGQVFPKWKPYIREWSKLEILYEQAIEFRSSGYRRIMYDLMKELEEEAMLLDGWVKKGNGIWERKEEI